MSEYIQGVRIPDEPEPGLLSDSDSESRQRSVTVTPVTVRCQWHGHCSLSHGHGSVTSLARRQCPLSHGVTGEPA
jgi:hypothetical protein